MKFPPARYGRTAIYAPLPPSKPPQVISEGEKLIRLQKFKEMKDLVNSQRCPLCSAQLEGPIRYDRTEVFCSAGGKKEYVAIFIEGLKEVSLSRTTFYTSNFSFEIESIYLKESLYSNTMYKMDLSLADNYRRAERKKLFNYEGPRLMLNKDLTEEQLLNKIKLYTIFS